MFAKESDMAASASSWLADCGMVVKSEFVSPWGICDLVGVRFNRSNVEHRLGFKQTKRVGSITRAALLLDVPDINSGKHITFKKLMQKYSPFVPEDVLSDEVDRLEADRFIQQDNQGRLQKRNGWMPIQETMVSVELKLSRVEEAMHQARKNLGFADQSYIGFPSEVAAKIEATSERWSDYFVDGIGLLSVSTTGCQVLIQAQKSQKLADKAIQLYCADKFWKGGITGNLASVTLQ